tara:strand:+ start:297 stop:1628 length:1332 start_codon:yes stop_codon:yes gene_type:complete
MSKVAELTAEELIEAVERKKKEDEAAKRGTSVEGSGDKEVDKQVVQLSPETERAIAAGLEGAMEKVLAKETESRAKKTGESSFVAGAIVRDAIELKRERKQREKQEDRFTAKWLSGLYQRNRDVMHEALKEESEFLGRETDVLGRFEERAMGAATAGDEFVPEVFSTRVIENIEVHGVARRECTIIPMDTDTMNFPKISTGLTAYEVSAGAAITASDLVTAQLTMNTRKLATITALHNELILNANPAIISILIDQAARALANKEDTLCLTGASSTVSGVLESSTNNVYLDDSSTGGSTAISDVDFDDLARLIDELTSPYLNDNTKFYFNKKVLYHLQLLKNSADYYLKPAAQGVPGTLHGFNYVTSSVMASAPAADTAFAFFGDLRSMWMGDRQRMEVKIGTEGTVGSDNLFEKDMSAVRVVEHVEFEIADAEGLAILKTDAS